MFTFNDTDEQYQPNHKKLRSVYRQATQSAMDTSDKGDDQSDVQAAQYHGVQALKHMKDGNPEMARGHAAAAALAHEAYSDFADHVSQESDRVAAYHDASQEQDDFADDTSTDDIADDNRGVKQLVRDENDESDRDDDDTRNELYVPPTIDWAAVRNSERGHSCGCREIRNEAFDSLYTPPTLDWAAIRKAERGF